MIGGVESAELSESRRSAARTIAARVGRISLPHRRRFSVAMDFLCSALAVAVALQLRFDLRPDRSADALVAAALPLTWVVVLYLRGSYDTRWMTTGAEPFRRVFESGFIILGGAAVISFLTHANISRLLVVIAAAMMTLLTLLTRYVARKQLHGLLARGRTIHEVVVAGSAREVQHIVEHMRRVPHAGFKVVAACILDASHQDATMIAGVPVVASSVEGLPAAVETAGADTLAVAGVSSFPAGALRRLSWRLEGKPVQLIVAPAVTDFAGPRIVVRPVDGLPLLHIDEPDLHGLRIAMKLVLDVTMTLILLIALSPLFLGIAVAIFLDDRGPVFFKQTRVGRGGVPFTMWKFRTMVVDAETLLNELRERNEHGGLLFKIKQDPRVTRVGAFLRRHSLDEMPQLFNVLDDTMSLVGPRPPLPSEVEQYGEDMRRRLLVRPGMTGLWQINGRSDLTWDESVRLDLYYVENWSPAMDFMVLWKTLAVVVGGHGGY